MQKDGYYKGCVFSPQAMKRYTIDLNVKVTLAVFSFRSLSSIGKQIKENHRSIYTKKKAVRTHITMINTGMLLFHRKYIYKVRKQAINPRSGMAIWHEDLLQSDILKLSFRNKTQRVESSLNCINAAKELTVTLVYHKNIEAQGYIGLNKQCQSRSDCSEGAISHSFCSLRRIS